MTFYSSHEQDKFLEMNVFKGLKNGTFVDVGAHDGVSINNTLYFEKSNNWKGINIEPNIDVYNALKTNRPECINLNCAVSVKDGTAEFILNKGYTEMISGLKESFDPRHVNRLNEEKKKFGGTSETVIVNTKRLETIFDDYKMKNIHYLSIDVEGAEFDVIKSIDFDKVFIDVICFEVNYEDSGVPIILYLQEKNYLIIFKLLDIIMIHKNSKFYVKNNIETYMLKVKDKPKK
uniref:Methyltransferase FkbM domain-containing protein n=1 Tax=viral metagenome TaxID=1070528 RepID=A0A6C0JEM7_9ZZZZ